jgi:hypothetical protein
VKVPGDDDRDSGRFDFFHIDQTRFSPDGEHLVIGLGKYFVFDVATEEEHVLKRGAISPRSIFSRRSPAAGQCMGQAGADSADGGTTLFTTAKQQPVTIWDLDRACVKTLQLPSEGGGPAVFLPTARRCVVSISQGQDYFHDLEGKNNLPSTTFRIASGRWLSRRTERS